MNKEMTKEEWERVHKIFIDIKKEFLLVYPASQNGKPKAKKDEAISRVNIAVGLANTQVEMNSELSSLLYADAVDGQHKAEIKSDFKNPRWFESEIARLIKAIEQKINQL